MANHKKPTVKHGTDSRPGSDSAQVMPELQWSKQVTAGQGGAALQLHRVEDALNQSQHVPRLHVVVPDGVPCNPMAPTPRQTTAQGHRDDMHTTRISNSTFLLVVY